MTRPDIHDPAISTALLARYLSGEATEMERLQVAAWVERDPRAGVLLDSLVGRTASSDDVVFDVETEWEKVVGRLGAAEPLGGQAPLAGKGTRWKPVKGVEDVEGAGQRPVWIPRLVYGAGIAVVLALGVILPRRWYAPQPERLATQEYVTRAGQHATVTLPDGSRVVLGPETRVRYTVATESSTPESGARTIDVRGQAFFTVTPNSTRLFVVRAGHATVRVLGTEFVVRKYVSDPAVQVIVASGKVSVQSTAPSACMATAPARTLVQVSDSGQITVTPDVSVDDALAWTAGRLVFRDAPATTVVADIGRRYDLVIRLADSSFSKIRLTALFDAETPTQALDLLAVAFNARYSRDGHVVTFTPTRRVLHSTPIPRLPSNSDNPYGR